MFEITPDITKEFISSKVSDEEIFEKYLGFSVSMKQMFKSPLRPDDNPTCTFFVRKDGTLIFKDHSGHFHGSCFDVVMYIYSVGFREALEIIATDFQLLSKKNRKKKPIEKLTEVEKQQACSSDIRCKKRNWNKKDLAYWGQYRITEYVLNHYNIYAVEYLWINGELNYTYNEKDPAYIYIFGNNEVKVYFPKRKKYRFLCNTNVLQGYNFLPAKGEFLVITKSYKDVIIFNFLGFASVAPQSESQIISQEQYDEFKNRFTHIVSWYDFDLAGIRKANKMRKLYGIKACFFTNGRFKSTNYGAKDISDFVVISPRSNNIEEIRAILSGIFTK